MPLIQSKSAAVRRSDISEDQRALKAFQESELEKGKDWWKDGVVIYWSNESAERFRASRGEAKPEPEPE